MAQITCRDVSLGYDGNVVVNNLNFSVNCGDYLCVIGENGAGKSTLIKGLLGLKAPMGGQFIFADGLKQQEIGYLPQQTVVQRDFPASVNEIVLSGCLNKCGSRPFYSANEKKLALDTMEKLGIAGIAKKCYRELSGGQQQRVLLARALCATSKLLVLDEPVSGLDPKAAAEMYDIIDSLNRDDKITIIMVSHDLGAALKYASHILHVSREPLYFGEKSGYLNSDAGRAFTGGEGDI